MQPLRLVVVPQGVVQEPAQRRPVDARLPVVLVQLADLACLRFRARRLSAQPDDLPPQARDTVAARLDAGVVEQFAQAAHLGPQGERVIRHAARFLRFLDRGQPLAAVGRRMAVFSISVIEGKAKSLGIPKIFHPAAFQRF